MKFNRSLWRKIIKNVIFLPTEILNFAMLPIRKWQGKPKPNPKSRFVFVISFPRSGTTALGSLIQQKGTQIHYHGEFFALNHWNRLLRDISKYYPFFMIRYFLGHLKQKRKWQYYQFEILKLNPDKALAALASIPGTHVFKIFPFHIYDASLISAIKKYRPEIIFLRRNHLDRLVSHKKAMVTGVWHGMATENIEVEIDETQLNKYVSDYESFYKNVLDCATKSSLNILDVEYESLFELQNINQVMKFILSDSKKLAMLNLKPRTLKQDSEGASQRIFLEKLRKDGVNKEISDFDFHRIQM